MEDSRTTLSRTSRQSSLTMSRASVREFDDKHLMQQIKQADVMHSETASDFERLQMVGLTSVPLKQEEEQSQQSNSGGGQDQQGDWNHSQPKGKSAEAVMLYLNGSRSHPVGIVDDRRVRPYGMKAGESALYDVSGNGQMTFFNDKGAYLVSVNNPQEQAKSQNEVERFASMRHVQKSKQSREIKKGQQVQEHKHEGETVNTEVRCTKDRIEFRIGDEVVAYIDKTNRRFVTKIETRLGDENADHPVYGVNGGVGKTAKTSGDGAVLIKAPQPGPPTSQDAQP